MQIATQPQKNVNVTTMCMKALPPLIIIIIIIITGRCLWCCHRDKVIARVHPVHLTNAMAAITGSLDPESQDSQKPFKFRQSEKFVLKSRKKISGYKNLIDYDTCYFCTTRRTESTYQPWNLHFVPLYDKQTKCQFVI